MKFPFELKITLCILAIVLMFNFVGSFKTTAQTSASSATISEYVAIALSGHFTAGINFGTVATNNLGNNAFNASNNSLFTISVSSDTNVFNASLCLNTTDLTSGGNTLKAGNFSYNASVNQSVLNNTFLRANFTNFTTTTAIAYISNGTIGATSAIGIGAQQGLGASNVTYWAFKLDVPDGQAPGTYSGTAYFTGVSSGAC